MSEEQQPFNEQEISDLDTARLALRGAVSTLRTMQDLVANLKSENQELVVREKAWKARVETMEKRLAEIHDKWQESQKLIQDYRQEIAAQLRNEIAVEEQEKWRGQIEQVQRTLLEWQKTREMREAELSRTQEVLKEREQDVRRLEQEKIAFEHKTQSEIASLLDKSRQALKDSVADAVEEKNQEIREVKMQWLHETEELKDALRRVESEMKLKEEDFQKDFHQKRRELEALWRSREEEAWKQSENLRFQTEAALKAQLQARLQALAKEREEQQADYQHRLEALEAQRINQERMGESVVQAKEAQIRERYQAELRAKEEQFMLQRTQFEQDAVRREADLIVRARKEEEVLRHSLRELEAELRHAVDDEMGRRQEALKKEMGLEKAAMEAHAAEEHHVLEAERERYQQESAEQRSRLVQEWLVKVADLEKKQTLEKENLQAAWDVKQKEWIQDHQIALNKAQESIAEKLAVMETVFVDRRAILEEDLRKRQADLETRSAQRDVEARQAWIQKESELNNKYQALIKLEKQNQEALKADLARERGEVQEQAAREKESLQGVWEKQKTEWISEHEALLAAQLRSREKDLRDSVLRDAEANDKAQKALFEQRERHMEEKFEKARAVLLEELLREKSLTDHYQQSLTEERDKSEETLRKNAEELALQRQKWELDYKDKDQLLEAGYKSRQADLEHEWERKEAELRNQTALQARVRETELEEKTKKHSDAEIARITQNLQERYNRQASAHEDEIERQRKQLAQKQAALEEEFKKERTRLRADLDKEKQAWLAERERQVQELALEKQRLEQSVSDRQAQMLKQKEIESKDLRETWLRKQEEWLKEHQKTLVKSEADLRAELAEKDLAIRAEYQAQLAEGVAQNTRLLEEHRKNLAGQFEQAKVVLLEETLQKEKGLTAQFSALEKTLAEKYKQALASERSSALTQVQKALESAERARQELEASIEEKRALLQAKYKEEEALLRGRWEAKEEEAAARLRAEIHKKENEYKESADRRVAEEVARRIQTQRDTWQKAHEEWLAERQAVLKQELFKQEEALQKQYRELFVKEREAVQREKARSREELHRAEEALEEKKKKLQEENHLLKERLDAAEQAPAAPVAHAAGQLLSQEMLGDLVFGIAHQIRNPLAVIRSATESMMETPGGSPNKQPFQAILNSAELLQDRLEQLIEFTKPVICEHKFVSAHDVVRQVEKVLGARCRTQRVKLDSSVGGRLPEVPIGREHLLSALLHLATNGLDAMERGGTLSISGKHLESQKILELQITDTGHGISPTDLKEMGRPFFTTRAGKVGLGVALAKRIVQAYGGDVSYESRTGAGATVRVRLPLEGRGV